MNDDCPFCTIPEREDPLYEDDLVYLVPTLDMKGHTIRVTVATRRHTTEPTFEETMRAYAVIYDYMNSQRLDEWFIVDSTFGRWPDHWHRVACDGLGTPEELEQLRATPKVRFPINPEIPDLRVMIGIPAYNEEEHIADVVSVAKEFGDVVVYNDASTDDTELLASSAGAKVWSVTNTLGLGRGPHGYGFGLKMLFDRARFNYDVLVTLDGDGQHNPEEIPKLLKALKKADMVIGNRFLGRSDVPFHRGIFIEGLNRVVGVGDSQSGFRAYNKKALFKLKITGAGFGVSLEILRRAIDAGLEVVEVPITITYEDTTHSQSPVAQGANLIETLFWGTVWARPLTVLGVPAAISFLLSMLFGAWTIYYYARSQDFVFSYALISIGGLLLWAMLCIATLFIMVQRRVLREMEVAQEW